MASVLLKPGVNTQMTPSLNEAGVSQSQLIRYKDNLIQTYGGCQLYNGIAVPSTVRSLCAWQDLNAVQHLGIGATSNLMVLTAGSYTDVTPSIAQTNPVPSFSISSGSNIVTVNDPNFTATTYDVVYFNTPVALPSTLLFGAYSINSVVSSGSYTILTNSPSTGTIVSSGKLPTFTTTANSAAVTVNLPNNNFIAQTGIYYNLIAPTSVGGLTVVGNYQVQSIIDSTQFIIYDNQLASSAATATMNSGRAQLEYYIAVGPQATGTGFGAGYFGGSSAITSTGPYVGFGGTGTVVAGSSGTIITSSDWSLVNWGEALLACQADGPIYVWSPNSGNFTASVIPTAPFFNGGIFVSQPQQILVAWKTCTNTGAQDPLEIRWSDALDYTTWKAATGNVAGAFHLPSGSVIVGGIQAGFTGVISTDIEVWLMQYIGGDIVFNFTKVGTGCGWIGPHAAGVLNGVTYWCSNNNFFMLSNNGVISLPCTVWDKIFQNINTNYQTRVTCAVTSPFNEITWYYPSAASTGENDSYVRVQVTAQGYLWDYGTLPRTAWVDNSILGMPIGTDPSGYIWQHEMGTYVPGVSAPSFRSGWFAISDGNEFSFVDFVIPDMIWGTDSGAKDAAVNLTFYAVDYPGDTPRSYGPYTVTQATEYINTRIRGRLMSVQCQSANTEFWRLGRIRYRFNRAGRR